MGIFLFQELVVNQELYQILILEHLNYIVDPTQEIAPMVFGLELQIH